MLSDHVAGWISYLGWRSHRRDLGNVSPWSVKIMQEYNLRVFNLMSAKMKGLWLMLKPLYTSLIAFDTCGNPHGRPLTKNICLSGVWRPSPKTGRDIWPTTRTSAEPVSSVCPRGFVGMISSFKSRGTNAVSVFAPNTLIMFSLVVGFPLVEKTMVFLLPQIKHLNHILIR